MQGRILIAVILVLLLIGLVFWLTRGEEAGNGVNGGNGDNGAGGGSEVELPPPKRLAELLAIHKRGVALAENAQNNPAIEEFEKVAAELPNEAAPVRNIAIVRLLAYEFTRTPAMLALVDEAFANWEPLETDRVLYHRLLGQKLLDQSEFQEAIDSFEAAAELAPDDASLWFSIYDVTSSTFDEDIVAQGVPAVERAYDLQQDNIILAVQHARDQADATDASVVATIDHLEQLVQPTRDSLERYLPPLDEYFADIHEAVGSMNWRQSQLLLRQLWNVVKPSDQFHSDRKRMVRHPLEFLAGEFSPEVMSRIPNELASIASEIAVSFAPQADAIVAEDVRDVALADVNLDGRTDLCILTGETFDVHWGTENGAWEAGPSVSLDGDFTSFIAMDIDGDKSIPFEDSILNVARPVSANTADIDFVLAGPSGILGLRNDLDPATRECTLHNVDLNAALEAAADWGGIVAGDFDSDGDIDLLVDTAAGTNMLWNTERWGFDVQSSETYNLPEGFRWSQADIADIDRDVDMDIVLSGNDGTLGYLEGLRHHAFRWRELATADEASPGSVSIVDIDGNASWDVLSNGIDSLTLHPSQTTGRGAISWRDAEEVFDDMAPSGFLTWDYDNDSCTDVLAWDADGVRILRGGDEGFAEGPSPGDIIMWNDVRDAAVADLDLDGDLDAVIADANGVHTLINAGGDANKWIDLLFVSDKAAGDGTGVGTNRVNNNAIGSTVEILADGVYQAHVIDGQRTHIGLGKAEEIDIIRAIWTNGAPENFLEAEPLQVLAERQTIITSCPYLYTWNGSEFVFVTDLLWAAPMGLPDPAGGLLPDRHWEYIRIPGDMLAASDGVYRLQITEELWEASYMDQVQLIAVDHPAGVDIFTNEKVGPASVAEHRIYTVSERRIPVAAANHRGEDVLSAIAAEDDRYLLLHEWRHMQGYTEDTTLELDLGEFPSDADLVLYLNGWIRPADANLHVRLQQDETLPGPQAPRIEIPDGQGGWGELLGYMGYPNGKTKTIAVPLPNEFTGGDHRIRIVTSTELYWDQIFFTVNEPDVEVRETQLPLTSADLHYRGVSALIPHPHNGPELYDYSRVATEPRFYPMEGKFTKFGDVLELLTTIDARHVVFGCGDEMTLEFAVPEEPLPEEWTRDFILYNVGWEKDCNTNGVLGRTTEPYPFVGMSAYPYPPGEAPPGGAAYQEYLDKWQTREMEHLPFLRFVQRFDRNSEAASNPTIISDALP